ASQPDSLQAPPPDQEDLQPQPKKKPDEQGDQQEELEMPAPDADGQQQQSAGQQKQDTPQGPKEREEKAGNAPGDTEGLNQNNVPELNQPQGNLSTDAVSEEEQRAQTRRARLRQANMSPEKAKLLLDAMRNAELQYIQQLPKRATRKADPGKPDW
ncbi:MAG: aerotolerance protein, partial [Pontibacter sp.]|nr:aerotolerance protein [Pontibacter sp.]